VKASSQPPITSEGKQSATNHQLRQAASHQSPVKASSQPPITSEGKQPATNHQ